MEHYTQLSRKDGSDVKLIVDTIACFDDSNGKAMYTIDKLKHPTQVAVCKGKLYTNFPGDTANIDGVLVMRTKTKLKGYPLVGVMRDPDQVQVNPLRQGFVNYYCEGTLVNLAAYDTHAGIPGAYLSPYSTHGGGGGNSGGSSGGESKDNNSSGVYISIGNYEDPPGEIFYQLLKYSSPRQCKKINLEYAHYVSTSSLARRHASLTSRSISRTPPSRSAASAAGPLEIGADGMLMSSSAAAASFLAEPSRRRRQVNTYLHSGCLAQDNGWLFVLDRRDDGAGYKTNNSYVETTGVVGSFTVVENAVVHRICF